MEAQANNLSWENYFMQVAELTAQRSKDPKTKVGAVIVKDKKILSIGYNGAPHLFPDELVPKDNINTYLEEKKNSYMVHAELNAILNYDGSLKDLNNASIYVTLFPCHECAKALAQVGIKDIIYKDAYDNTSMLNTSKKILSYCKIKYRRLENDN